MFQVLGRYLSCLCGSIIRISSTCYPPLCVRARACSSLISPLTPLGCSSFVAGQQVEVGAGGGPRGPLIPALRLGTHPCVHPKEFSGGCGGNQQVSAGTVPQCPPGTFRLTKPGKSQMTRRSWCGIPNRGVTLRNPPIHLEILFMMRFPHGCMLLLTRSLENKHPAVYGDLHISPALKPRTHAHTHTRLPSLLTRIHTLIVLPGCVTGPLCAPRSGKYVFGRVAR